MEKITENLYLFEDTCNVYVVKDGTRALLVDFGSGKVLDHLSEIGVTQVDWILHTHHHRDQCQGDSLANERRIPIAVPAHERPYFEEVEVFWGSRQIYNIYNVRQSFFTLTDTLFSPFTTKSPCSPLSDRTAAPSDTRSAFRL